MARVFYLCTAVDLKFALQTHKQSLCLGRNRPLHAIEIKDLTIAVRQVSVTTRKEQLACKGCDDDVDEVPAQDRTKTKNTNRMDRVFYLRGQSYSPSCAGYLTIHTVKNRSGWMDDAKATR